MSAMEARREQPEGLPELLTPEEIESTFFPESDRGYDKAHVDAFVIHMARQARHLAREFAALKERSSAPYMRVGKEMAELLDHARRVANGITERARTEAEAMAAEVSELRSQASRRVTEAEERARAVLAQAQSEAKRLVEEAENGKRLAEVQASIRQEDLMREERRLRDKAEGVLGAARDRAEAEYEAARRKAEDRVRKLAEMEKVLKRRLIALDSKRRVLEATVNEPPAPKEREEPAFRFDDVPGERGA